METKILEILAYTIPSVITGCTAYYLFALYFNDQQNNRKWTLQKDAQNNSLPIRLQAFERMTLFLERSSLTNVISRISPISENKADYASFVIAHIEQEFEHNLAQQIYISNDCWNVILTAKNATIQIVRKASTNENCADAQQLREFVLNEFMEKQTPSATALEYIKKEVSEMW